MFAVNVDVALRGSDGRWLLIVRGAAEAHAAGLLSLVGGTVDVPAAPCSALLEDTARREVLEEIGVDMTGLHLAYVESTFFVTDDGEPVLNVVFGADLPAGAKPYRAAPEEVADLCWVSPDDTDQLPSWTAQSLELAGRSMSVLSQS